MEIAKMARTKKPVENLNKIKNQNAFLETSLRGTGRTLSKEQAVANYGIQQLPARIFELKSAGMVVKTVKNTCLLYTSPSPRDLSTSRMPSSA